MTSLLLGSLGAAGIAVLFAMAYRRDALMWRARAQHWFDVSRGDRTVITSEQAERIMANLFPRPMGARAACDAQSLSTVEDVASLRAWREHRALKSIDHTTRHSVDAVTDGEAATEIMQFCVGPMECEGE